MKYILSPRILKIANHVAKIPGFKSFLKPFYYNFKKYINHKRTQAFLKNGHQILKEFDKVMVENGYHYSVFAGTLLGAIREHSFIKHDCDIDTMLFHDEYSNSFPNILQNKGFRLIHRFEIEGGSKGLEETYEKDNVSIDIFFIYSDEKYPTYQCDFRACEGTTSFVESMVKCGKVITRRNEFPVSREIKRVFIDNIEVNAIANAEEWLASRYGDNFMTPNPHFKDKGDNPNMKFWNDVDAIYREF